MQRSGKAFGSCSRCETVPEKIEGRGGLYLWFPVSHTLNKVISALPKAKLEFQLLEDSKWEHLKYAMSINTIQAKARFK